MNNDNHGYSIKAFRDMLASKDLDKFEQADDALRILQSRLLDLWESVQYAYGVEPGWKITESGEREVSEALENLDGLARHCFKKIGAVE